MFRPTGQWFSVGNGVLKIVRPSGVLPPAKAIAPFQDKNEKYQQEPGNYEVFL
jgi:hypothetical protein